MGEFFVRREGESGELWLYSERGLVSYLVHYLLPKAPIPVLREATNGRQTLYDAIGAPIVRHTAIGEFNLNPEGFGCPDGGFLGVHENLLKVFAFVEAKAVLEKASFQDPAVVAKSIDGVDWDTIPKESLEKHCRDNTFNSSLNGQIELRWRFVNAFRQGHRGREMRITEQAVPAIDPSILRTDRFYWRRKLRPSRDVVGDWRSVNMAFSKETNLLPLYEAMRSENTRFFLLAITPDTSPPAGLNSVRLFNPAGDQRVPPEDFVYWLPLRFISDYLERP